MNALYQVSLKILLCHWIKPHLDSILPTSVLFGQFHSVCKPVSAGFAVTCNGKFLERLHTNCSHLEDGIELYHIDKDLNNYLFYFFLG